MIVTEKQAAEMWCPAARAVSVKDGQEVSAGVNRAAVWPLGDGLTTRCIGSQCMWWRWAEPKYRLQSGATVSRSSYSGDMGGITDTHETGYCGAATAPTGGKDG